ncbi:MAG: nucleotidyl transferase AbiEii/AbiGii toxin family protein [Patescibacteria group bacterium]
MAKQVKILTEEQESFLEAVSESPYLVEKFYFTGGTPLAAFYLNHRLSEDIDLFSENEIFLPSINTFIGKIRKELRLTKVDYRQFFGLHSFQLFFLNKEILKVDFNYYPFPRIEKGTTYKQLKVDSLLDIAVNKVHTIAMKPRARDFIDIYFIIKKTNYNFHDLLMKAKAKFDWHIDPIQLGSRLFLAKEVADYPRMIKKINHQEWRNFFLNEAKKLKNQILE